MQKGSAVAQEAFVFPLLQVGPLCAQIENVPVFPLPYPQNLIYTVDPGARPVCVKDGIKPFALPSSLHPSSVNALHAPLYTAIPPSVITPVLESKIIEPLAGTTALNHTSAPW